MARIDYADTGALPPAEAPVLEKIAKGRPFIPNLYRLLLVNPPIADRWVELANTVRFESDVSDRARELSILVVSHITGCEYEWHHHSSIAEGVGLTPDEIESVRRWPETDTWGAEDRAVVRVVGSMAERQPLPAAELDLLVESWGERTVLALAATVAYYVAVAHLLLAMEVEVEDE
jgi:4-carboxymuconolactone decarboxylase